MALVAGIAAIAGVIVLGKLSRQQLDDRGHYAVKLADLDLPAPPGVSKANFLAEVKYNHPIPDVLDRTDPAARLKLQQALAAHPWVESVTVGDLSDPKPVTLVIRVPTLAVGQRVLDRQGVLLPLTTSTMGLPSFRTVPDLPATPSGKPYPDVRIVGVAKTLGWLRGQLPEVKWQSADLNADGLVLTRDDGATATWGFGKAEEPPADAKLARLRQWKAGPLDLRTK
ncbi:MAG: hypothetical protein K1X57_11030 [Gemmataceae bacterium]|nr:hypothetical protein [Gemmataceae bacterium]